MSPVMRRIETKSMVSLLGRQELVPVEGHDRADTGQKRSSISDKVRTMARPTAQVLTLLELLQSGGIRTMAELAGRLGVEPRTVRRYVDHLIDLDVPVESVRGRYGGYRLPPRYPPPPPMLRDHEAPAGGRGPVPRRRPRPGTAMGTARG